MSHGQSPSEIREILVAAGGQKMLLQMPTFGLFPLPSLPKSPLGPTEIGFPSTNLPRVWLCGNKVN